MLARRRELGLTQEELARRIADDGDPAFRQSDVSRLERGRVGLPRRDRLERVARALGLPLGELLARSGWAGAAEALPVSANPTPTPSPEPEDRLLFAAPIDLPPAAQRPAIVRDERLRDLIARAEETRGRSVEILRRCEDLWGPGGRYAAHRADHRA